MKKKIIFSIATILAISLTAFTSCNQQGDPDADSNAMENNQLENSTTERSENLAELKEELKDVGTEIEQLTAEESKAFKAEAEAVITDFKARLKAFENKADATGEEISESTRTALDSLEQQAVRIESKLKVLGETTEQKAAEFKEELEHDFNDLGKSIRNFFNDNA